MVLHGELYRLRPPARSLTTYYLCTSGGGALGGLAVGLVAPRVFDGFYEFPIGLGLACVLVLAAWRMDPGDGSGRPRRSGASAWPWRSRAWRSDYAGAAAPRPISQPAPSRAQLLRRAARRAKPTRPPHRALLHGTTMHGAQIEGWEDKATTYYGLHTGIEIALKLREPGVPIEVGVIGLGAGTLAAYGQPGDHFRFFEIDPAVIQLTRDGEYFTFIARSKARGRDHPGRRADLGRARARAQCAAVRLSDRRRLQQRRGPAAPAHARGARALRRRRSSPRAFSRSTPRAVTST